MNRAMSLLCVFVLAALAACATERIDPGVEESHFATVRSEQNLALSYLKRAQFAREKQVEYLELAEIQEKRLRDLRVEVSKRRADNKKLAEQVRLLAAQNAALEKTLKDKKVVTDKIAAEKATIAKLEKEARNLEVISKLKQEILDLKVKQDGAEEKKNTHPESSEVKTPEVQKTK